MKTTSIDVAAFLYVNGVMPTHVTVNSFRFNEFEYADGSWLHALISGYNNGAMVPAREYAEARAIMKDRGWRTDHNFRNARQRNISLAIDSDTDLPKP